jgi:type III secretory pathway component EscV
MIEAEQGEFIVNRKQTSIHRRELNALNQSSEAFKKLIQDRYVRPALMDYILKSKKDSQINVNAMLNSKAMEDEIRGLRKDIRSNSKIYYNNQIDSRYQWQQR